MVRVFISAMCVYYVNIPLILQFSIVANIAALYMPLYSTYYFTLVCLPVYVYIDQQDAQEFLSELLDALHEDLNRYRKTTTPPLTTPSALALPPPAAATAAVLQQQEGQSQGHSDQPFLTKNGEQGMGQANRADGDNKLQLTQPHGVINVEVS